MPARFEAPVTGSDRSARLHRLFERVLFLAGVAAGVGAALLFLDARLGQAVARVEFDRMREPDLHPSPAAASVLHTDEWAPARLAAFAQSASIYGTPSIARIDVPAIELSVQVFRGTDETTLNRGAGLIEGTAEPGGPGNICIAGHRDGFFRRLRDVSVGDRIELTTPQRQTAWRVDRISIVEPEEVSVLDPTVSPRLTLVTCFPFWFAGSAPQRFVVTAVPESAAIASPDPVSAPVTASAAGLSTR